MRRTNWFRKVVTAIVALGLVCQMSFSGTVAYAAWDDESVWQNEEQEWNSDDGWEYADNEEADDWEEDDTEEDEDNGWEEDDGEDEDNEDEDDGWEEADEDELDEEDDFEEPELSSTSLTLKAGSVAGLNVTGDYEYIEWSSSKASVAKVDSSGTVKAVKAGSTVIKAKVTCFIESEEDYFDEESEDEDFFDEEYDEEDTEDVEGEEVTYTLTCKVKVTASTVKISAKKLTIKKGKSAKLKITGTTAKVTWKSSNKKVATVNKGTVKAKKAGKTTITAKVSGKTLKCSVTVKKNK